MILNDAGEIFLQRRGPQKDTFPGFWDTGVGGHCDPGESDDEAARREIHEELGLEGHPRLIGHHAPREQTGWEFVSVYELVTEQTPLWDGVEIVDGQWLSAARLESLMADSDFDLTPAFRLTHRLWHDHNCPAEAV